MADQTTSSILISAEPAAVMAVIADFDAYPAWAKGVKSATVLSTDGYEWEDDAQVTWSLIKAKMLKTMEGAYILSGQGDETEVTYQLAVDLTIPMIGMLKRKGEKVIIDTALKGLKKRVELQA